MVPDLSEWRAVRVAHLKAEVRNLYWHIRNSQRGRQDAYRRRYYRKISKLKTELLALGESRRAVLDLVACCRAVRCRVVGCQHCGHRVNWKAWV
ncbi:hypothetical protein [Cupriavidus sp. WS]|uniref:hypothetical protein n=1 Tax=Cupriavidus sp. WS TaxID=1312922 RepID=UPI001E29F7B3|nr:hypothetical protein [Cupriavidus sp. WS]